MKVEIKNMGQAVIVDYEFSPEEISKIEEIRTFGAPIELAFEMFLRDTKSNLMSGETLSAVCAILRHLQQGFPNSQGFEVHSKS